MIARALTAGMLVALAVLAAGVLVTPGGASAQDPPPPLPSLPALFSGEVTVAGEVPDRELSLVARVGDYESEPVLVQGGSFETLIVAPPAELRGQVMAFHIGNVQAEETRPFQPGDRDLSLSLSFSKYPDPTPTPTPVRIAPAVYKGSIVIVGGVVPGDAMLVARVGTYESAPAVIADEGYKNLVVIPASEGFIGQPVTFFLNGIESAPLAAALVFTPGEVATVDLVFLSLPTPTPTPEPTATPEPTPEPTPTPTPTPEPTPTRTPEPTPTATPEPPPVWTPPPTTPTAAPVTPTAAPATPAPSPTATPEPDGGGCGAGQGPVAANLGGLSLLLLPLGLAAMRFRRRSR